MKMNHWMGVFVMGVLAGRFVSGVSVVPDIVHQTYDYQSPNFFLFLSILCVQRFLKPAQHILWVNDEGRYRRAHWDAWQRNAKDGTWEGVFRELIQNKTLDVRLITFPAHPEGKPQLIATNKAHRSDFARMQILQKIGGVYLDTDAFPLQSLHELYKHEFTIAFDNIVNADPTKPKRMNNGVLLAAPNASFLALWQREYQQFNPSSFDYDSSVVPLRLATMYPDVLHVEMNRLSPISYGFQTAHFAEALTCGIFLPPGLSTASTAPVYTKLQVTDNVAGKGEKLEEQGMIWSPQYNADAKSYSFEQSYQTQSATQQPARWQEARYLYEAVSKKLALHLTMSQVRGLCMMRKQLSSPEDLHIALGPSFLGHLFRLAYYGYDDYYHQQAKTGKSVSQWTAEEQAAQFTKCRQDMGMFTPPQVVENGRNPEERQQYRPV